MASTSRFSVTIRNVSSPTPAASYIVTAGASGRVNFVIVFVLNSVHSS
jgi:hypothetical protein